MQHELPIHSSLMSKWRKRVGAERLEKLLEATIHTALAMKTIKPQELAKVNVDTTVQEKAIACFSAVRVAQSDAELQIARRAASAAHLINESKFTQITTARSAECLSGTTT